MKTPRFSLGHPKSSHLDRGGPRIGLLAAVGWVFLWVTLWVEDRCHDVADALDRWRGR